MNYRKNDLIAQLIANFEACVKPFDNTKMKEVFIILQSAKSQGFLGANRPKSICLNEWVNTANDLLRQRQSADLIESLASSEATYAYIALVSLNCFKQVVVATA